MTGTLIPPWYHEDKPSCNDLAIVSCIWGLSLGLALFGAFRAGDQTFHQWRRKRKVTAYMVFIWVEVISSSILGGVGWGHVYGTIPAGLGLFLSILILWAFQTHCIMQIIINRVALIAVNPTVVFRLRWSVFAILLIINISVGCIWIPARLQIDPSWIHVNAIYDRIEKCIFAVIDVGLNLYFIYLVRSSLIQYGLNKYMLLYRFNLGMIVVSLTMDVLIIATMSLDNSFLYVIFHPLAYLVKLHIELSMANLIAKIVKATGGRRTCDCSCHTHTTENNYNLTCDLNDDLTRHSAPAALGRARGLRSSWRRSIRFFASPLAEGQPPPQRRASEKAPVMKMPPPRPTLGARSASWAGPRPMRKDSGFWFGNLTNTSKSNEQNDDCDDHDPIDENPHEDQSDSAV